MAITRQHPEVSSTSIWRVAITTSLLALAFSLSYMDRQILPLLLEPVKLAFQLTDTQIGLLQGLAFGTFYGCSGFILGALVDRYHRVAIASACVVAWGLATAACGLSGSFGQLFLARTSTAVGEAGCSPASYSILSDMLSGRALLRATAVYHTGPYVGGGMALILGSATLRHYTTAGGLTVPWFGHLAPWQAVFLVLGLPGVLLGGALLFLREPKRNERNGMEHVSTKAALKYLLSSPQLMFYFAGWVFISSGLYVLLTWFPSVLIREGLGTAATIGRPLGIVFLIVGLLSAVSAQGLLRRIDDKNLLGSLLKRLTVLLAIQLPLTVALAFARSEVVAYGFYACEVAIFAAVTTYMVAPIQLSVPNRMRGRAAGLFMTFNYLIGASLGPAAVGLLSDRMKGATHGLLTAFVIVLGVSCAASIFMFYFSATRRPASHWENSLDPIEATSQI